MKDRFNIVLDDILDRRIDTMASIGQDTYDNGYDNGAENKSIDIIIALVSEEGWEIDRAMRLVKIPDDRSEYVRNEILKRLN